MIDDRTVARFAHWVTQADRILCITHENPDGDGLASALAMGRALTAFGKHATCVTVSPIPPAFQFLPGVENFQHDFLVGDYDLVIAFDCGDIRRTGFGDRLRSFAKERRRLINIDHHPKNDLHRLANLNITNYDAAATAQIVYHLLKQLAFTIDHHSATALLCGLHTDTGGFKHPNTTPEVLQIAADLMRRGARHLEITRRMKNRRSMTTLKLWGLALDRIRLHQGLGIVSVMITLDDLVKCSATHDDVAGLVNLLKEIPKTRLAVVFSEQPDGSIRASLRSDVRGVDVAQLAALFGGGGLKKAGGFSIPGRLIQDGGHWDIEWQAASRFIDINQVY